MPPGDFSGVEKGGIGAVAGGAVTEATVGLDRAWQAAGDVLSGIFGGAPWSMSAGEIVDSVTGTVLPAALDVGVMLA